MDCVGSLGPQAVHPVAQQARAGVAGFLGVELGGAQRPVLHGGDEGCAVLGPRDQGRRHARLDDVKVPLLDAVGVHEVEALVLDPREEPGALGDGYRVPAHVGDDVGRQQLDLAGPLPHALGFCAVFDPASNRTWRPTQMASTGRPPATRRPIMRTASTALSSRITVSKAPTPGTTRPSALSTSSGLALRITWAPARSRARTAERTFPDP